MNKAKEKEGASKAGLLARQRLVAEKEKDARNAGGQPVMLLCAAATTTSKDSLKEA